MTISVAIVGSGPAGFYTADALTSSGDDVSIDIIERLPTPYGLIRGGVAPDHQTTKKVQKKYEEIARRDQVRFFGNVEVGRDVSLREVRSIYDAVVLAVGAPHDRPLGVPGEDKRGVFGSAAFVGWYNGHPDFRTLNPNLNVAAAVVVGVGNVAIDAARLLSRSKDELAETDLPDYAERAILSSPVKDIYLLGRRGPVEAKFTNVELREMGRLSESVPVVVTEQIPNDVRDLSERDKRLKERNLETLREFSKRKPDEKPKRVHFEFYAAPVEILGNERVEGLKVERTRVEGGRAVGTGEFFEIPCGLVVAAIGYCAAPIEGAPFDEKKGIVPNDDGRVGEGLYAAGWIKRGPTGVIASNRPDGEIVAEHIRQDFSLGARESKPGRSALAKLLGDRKVRVVSFEDWKRLETAETANAEGKRPRKKFVAVRDMLDYLNHR